MAEYLSLNALIKFVSNHFGTLIKFITDHKYLFLDIALVSFLVERSFRFMRFGIRSVIEAGISIVISFILSYYVITPIIIALINGSSATYKVNPLSNLRIFIIFLPIVVITSSMLIRLRILGSSKTKPVGFFDSMLGMIFGLFQGLFWVYIMYLAMKFLIIVKPELVESMHLDLAREMYLNLESAHAAHLKHKHHKKHHDSHPHSEKIKAALTKSGVNPGQEIRDTILFKLLYFFKTTFMPVERMVLNYHQDMFEAKWGKCVDEIKTSSVMWEKNVLSRVMPKFFDGSPVVEEQPAPMPKSINIDYIHESEMASMHQTLNNNNQ